jgi:hypothetical protein
MLKFAKYITTVNVNASGINTELQVVQHPNFTNLFGIDSESLEANARIFVDPFQKVIGGVGVMYCPEI